MNLMPPPITKTAAKRQAAFESDFKKLLKKHKAHFQAGTIAQVTMLDECNGTHILAEFVEFNLPVTLDGASL